MCIYVKTMSYFVYWFLMISNVYAFTCLPKIYSNHHNSLTSIRSMSNDYLNKLNDYSEYLDTNTKVKRLESIRNNIVNYIKTKKDDDSKKMQIGFKSTYQPIPKVDFDTIFLNINHICQIYISSNVDRMIFELTSGKRYVYYIRTKEEYNKMDQLIKLIPRNHKTIIINDIYKVMDDPFGFLYCEKK